MSLQTRSFSLRVCRSQSLIQTSFKLRVISLAAYTTHISTDAFVAHSWRLIFSLILPWGSEPQLSVNRENVQLCHLQLPWELPVLLRLFFRGARIEKWKRRDTMSRWAVFLSDFRLCSRPSRSTRRSCWGTGENTRGIRFTSAAAFRLEGPKKFHVLKKRSRATKTEAAKKAKMTRTPTEVKRTVAKDDGTVA